MISDYPNELNAIRRGHLDIDGAISDITLAVESILPCGEDLEFDEIIGRLSSATNDLECWVDKQSK